ncbi:signal peptidase I [Leifsonia kafniensis]
MDKTSDEFSVALTDEAEGNHPSASAVGETAEIVAETKPAPEKGLWSYLGLALSAALLLLVVALAAATVVIPKLAGALPMTVLTSSMEPGLPPGTLIIVKPINPDDLAIGDIATYQIESGKPGVITHRIIGINLIASGERTFVFMGDNNGVADADAVQEVQIQGKLWYSIPLIGWVNNLVNGANKVWIVPVLAGLLFAYAGYMFVSGLAAANRARRVRRNVQKKSRGTEVSVADDAEQADAAVQVDDAVQLDRPGQTIDAESPGHRDQLSIAEWLDEIERREISTGSTTG